MSQRSMHPTINQRKIKSLQLPTLAPSFTTLSLSNILRFIAVWLVSIGFRGVFVGGRNGGHRFGPATEGGHQLTIWDHSTLENDTLNNLYIPRREFALG